VEFEVHLNTHTGQDQLSPSVAVAPAGDFVVVWYDYWQGSDFGGIFGQSFRADGLKMGSEFHVNAFYTWDEQAAPAVASLGTEKFVVVWQSNLQDGSDWGVFGRLYGDLVFRDGFESADL
jgi:hypothetical protein